MFDIGFTELLVIGVVALIVIGPEKLPRMARTVGHLAGRLQRYVSDVKADINREIELDELRKMRDSMQQAASNFESSVQSEMSKTETEVNKSVEEMKQAVDNPVDWRERGGVETANPAQAQPAPAAPDPSEIGIEEPKPEPQQDARKPEQAKAG
jgi:sec-independent protein translocase protein TatB